MNKSEDEYDPLAVEAAIDEAYSIAEDLSEYREEITDLIESFEEMPYSVNRDGKYSIEQITESVEALNSIENYYWAAETDSEDIRRIESLLKEDALVPARDRGKII